MFHKSTRQLFVQCVLQSVYHVLSTWEMIYDDLNHATECFIDLSTVGACPSPWIDDELGEAFCQRHFVKSKLEID